MELNQIKALLAEKKANKKDKEELSSDIENVMSTSKKPCCEELEYISEISQYDLVVTYYRHLGLDPYKLRGKSGIMLRNKIKESPGYLAWRKAQYNESLDMLDEVNVANLTSEKDLVRYSKDLGFNVVDGKSHKLIKHPTISHKPIPFSRNTHINPNQVRSVVKAIDKILKAHNLKEEDEPKKETKVDKLLKASKKVKADVEFYNMSQGQDKKGTDMTDPNSYTCNTK